MSRKTRKIILTSVILVLAVAVSVIIAIIHNPDKPTIDSTAFNNPGMTEDPNIAKITFPEGLTVTEIAEKLDENGVCNKYDFLYTLNNPTTELLQSLGITDTTDRIFTLEGYVFPDTYEFYKGESAASVLRRFTDNFSYKITEKDRQRAAELGYTMDEIITIASIIQEEAGRPDQDYKVSSVIHNRLKTGTKIECDVTITYLETHCKPYIQGGLTDAHRQNYNTYKCPALPKGPICNPGYAAIQAALYPDETSYLFFVTDENMNYYYATTWSEHVENCRLAGIEGY